MDTSILQEETARLHHYLQHVGWSMEDCVLIAPITLEINQLKKEQNAIILAHTYQTPDIMYGVADHIGDSYGLSKIAAQTRADKIVFCSVQFMGETAKILNPDKQVLIPAFADCSLAQSITAADVIKLRQQHPNAAVVCYVNTSAAVKAMSDVCCTSANAVRIVNAVEQDEVIFIPDQNMATNLQNSTTKQIISWPGKCIVHENFTPESILAIRETYPGVKILAHTECSPSVISLVDLAGGTGDMMDYIKASDATTFMLVTECGISDRIRAEFPGKQIVGTCNLCPYMKKIMLKDVLQVLKSPRPDQIIELEGEILRRARKSLDKMFGYEKK
jgi:quinolinate synthase